MTASPARDAFSVRDGPATTTGRWPAGRLGGRLPGRAGRDRATRRRPRGETAVPVPRRRTSVMSV